MLTFFRQIDGALREFSLRLGLGRIFAAGIIFAVAPTMVLILMPEALRDRILLDVECRLLIPRLIQHLTHPAA
jgi:hypothetical protein